jgi:hypothetical protein
MTLEADYFPGLLERLRLTHSDSSVMGLLTEAAASHPADARPLLLLAAEFVQAHDLDRAEATYVGALQRAPQFWIARFQLGLLQFTSARPAIAFVTWAPLDALEASHPLRLFKRAFECLADDAFEQATQLLHMGIAANTANPPLNQDMAMVIERIAQVQSRGKQPTPASEAAEPPADTHFLVSSYRNIH